MNEGAETINFDEQVTMSITDNTIKGQDKNPRDINGNDMQQLEQQVQYKEIYHPRGNLDNEIENIRMLMEKMF